MRHHPITVAMAFLLVAGAVQGAKKDPFKKEFPMVNVMETEHGEVTLTDAQVAAIEELNNRKLPYNDEEFLDAVTRGDADLVKIFLRAGMSPNTRIENDWPAIMVASFRGYADVIEALVEAKAFLNLKNSRGWTPLLMATHLSKNDAVKMLVAKGADISLPTPQGFTALMLAVEESNAELVALFLKKGANPREKNEGGVTATNIAVENNKEEILDAFRKAGYGKLIESTRASIREEKKKALKKYVTELKARKDAAPKLPPTVKQPQ